MSIFKSTFIQKLLVLYVIVWTVAPPLQIDSIYRFAALGAVILWFILNIPYDVSYKRIHVLAIVFALLVMLVALVEFGGVLSDIFKPFMYYMLIIAFLLAYAYKDRWEELSGLIPIVLIILIYFNFQSYFAVVKDPAIARLLVRNDPELYVYMRSGVGGYGLLYPQVCVFPAILYWTICAFRKHKIKFVIGAVWTVSYLLFMFNSGYTIALVTTIVSAIILLVYKRNSIVLAVVITSVIILLLVWLIGYVDGFRLGLMDFFEGTKVAVKIDDVYQSITSADAADSISMRIAEYSASLNMLFTYPFIGCLWNTGIGVHSAALDSFAKYGVFGGYMFIKMFFSYIMQIKRSPVSKKDVRFANALFISLLLVSVLDSVSFNFTMMVLIVVPVLHNDIVNWSSKKNEDSVDSKPDTVRSLAKAAH